MKRYIKASKIADLQSAYESGEIDALEDDIWEEYLEELDFEVQDELGIMVEPNVQFGVGSVDILNADDYECLASVNYKTFNRKQVMLGLKSKDDQDFKRKLTAYYKKLLA